MEKEKKLKLMEFLFPNENARKFLCNDLYFELTLSMIRRKPITLKNITQSGRAENLKILTAKIQEFMNQHNEYLIEILKIYGKKNLADVMEEILIGYTFYFSQTHTEYKDIDIFKDKRSICFAPVSVIDFM